VKTVFALVIGFEQQGVDFSIVLPCLARLFSAQPVHMPSVCAGCVAFLFMSAATLALPSTPSRTAIHFQASSTPSPEIPRKAFPFSPVSQLQIASKHGHTGSQPASIMAPPPPFPAFRNSPDYQVQPACCLLPFSL
jgi:hypothetical protein